MKPNDEIKKFMAAELAAGVTLSEVQNVINERFGCKLTFMDIRILAAEIESIDWSSRDPAPVEPKADEPAAGGEAAPGGKTKIETSKILRPGTLAGGTVEFASGASAEWFVDQRGQLGLDKVKGEPNETDVREFQQELQKLFGR